MRDRWLKDYELVLIAWCDGLGSVWTFIAFWVTTSWEPALPTLDIAGAICGILLLPAWITLYMGIFFYGIGIDPFLAWLTTTLLFLLGGFALVLHMRR
jgi:hypothetical protein